MVKNASRVRWMVVTSLFLTYVLMFIDRVNISIAAKYIMDEFAISSVQMGAVFSTFVFGYALFQIPGGWLGDRFGPRRVLGFAIIWWSVFTALTAWAPDSVLASSLGVVGALAVIRLLIGIGEAAAPPNGARTIANWVAPNERGLAFGITFSGNTIGAAIAPPLIVWIMITFGWREAFYISGAAGIFIAAVWYWISTDRPEGHAWVNEAELRHIRAAPDGLVDETSDARSSRRDLFRRKELWYLTGAYFTVGYILYLYFAWFYLYLVNGRGLSVQAAGFYTMAPFVISAICAPLGGKLTDILAKRYGKKIGRAVLGIFGLLFTGLAVVAGAAVSDPTTAVILLSLGAGATYASMAAYWAACLDISAAHAGMASGFMNMGCNFGGVLSPILTPFIAEQYGWHTALYVAAAVAACGALFWIGLLPKRVPAIPRPQPL